MLLLLGNSQKTLPAYTFNLRNSNVARALNGETKTIALFLHEQDNTAETYSYEGYFYRNATPRQGLIGWGGQGYCDESVTSGDPIISMENPGGLTNVNKGVPQLPFNRAKPGKAWDSDDGLGGGSGLLGRLFDTSANAFSNPALIVPADFTFGYSCEFAFDDTTPVDDGYLVVQFKVQLRDSGNEWMAHQLKGTFFVCLAGENATGVNPIVGPSKLQIGSARDFDTPTINGGTIEAGVANSLVYEQVTIPSGAADTVPVLTVHSLPTYEFDNLATRFAAAGAFFISNTATKGVAVHCVANPYTNSFDFGTGADFKIMDEQVFTNLHDGINFNCIIIRTGGWLGESFLSSNNQPTQISALKDTTDPKIGSVSGQPYNTAPFGDYTGDFIESEDDRQRNIHTDVGIDINVTQAYPTLFIHSHWIGAGTTFAEAEVIRATTRKSLEWGITHPTTTPNHLESRQVWLYNAGLVDPWWDIPLRIFIVSSYIRATGTQINALGEVWTSGRSYAAGDVVCDPNAADYLLCNEGWYFCKVGGAHTSAASGVNGPPSDGSSTRWTKVNFALSDAGKNFETTRIWQTIRDAI